MKPEYRKKTGRATRENKGGRPIRKDPARVRVEDREPAGGEPVTVNRVTCDNSFPGGFRIDVVPVQPGERV